MMKWFKNAQVFDWDEGNRNKNFIKHRVTDGESEEVFFDPEKIIASDESHSGQEARYLLIGKTKREGLLFVVFTIRDDKVRIISARNLNKKEKKLYEKSN